MPHKEGCQCPACRYRRGEGKGESPHLSVRLSEDVKAWIMSRPEGARAYLEQLVRRDMATQQEPKDGPQE